VESQVSLQPNRRIVVGRWTFLLALMVVVTGLSHSWTWALAMSIPLICSALAVQLFPERALETWLRNGYLLTADLMLASLALAGTRHPQPLAFVALFGVLALAVFVADRMKALLAGGALLGAICAMSAGGLLPGAGFGMGDLLYLPALLAAACHFGYLAEHLSRRGRPEEAESRDRGELWALLDITDTITSTLDVRQVMHSIVERVGDLTGTPSCSILLSESDSPGCFVMGSKGHPEANMLELDLDKYPEVQHALRTRQVVVIDDVDGDPVIAPVRDVVRSKGVRSIVVLPLLFGKETLGALFLRSRETGAFTKETLRFCKVAACVSANALKNAMLYRDVTREAARNQATSEKLRRIVDGTPDMIVATDRRGRVVEFNPGAVELTGWSLEKAMGEPFHEILGREIDPNGDGGAHEVELPDAAGRSVTVSLVSAPLCGSDGRSNGRVWIGRDVTQLRRVERSLAQAERLSSLGEVVAGVAHELNNPLSGVVGYAELLRGGASDPGQIQDLQRIVESAMRCQKIVFNLLSFARKHPPEKKYQSLNDCVTRVLDLKSYHLQSSQIQTVLELEPGLPETSFDLHQIDQVILNLLNNAGQAIGAANLSGQIVLRTGSENGHVYVEVEDDGPGVPESVRDRVFDPFFTTKALGQGTGLGLSVSYGIVQEHGGRIELRSRKAGQSGARFRVWLPIVEGERPEESPQTSGSDAGSVLSGKRILVAEDEPVVLEVFSRLLMAEGAQVTMAQDGEEAWQRLEHEDYDLVIADLRMPNLSGQELYQRVSEERPEMLRRFVFATGDLMRHETMSFLEGLPNRILTKPLEQETVRRVLAQALDAA